MDSKKLKIRIASTQIYWLILGILCYVGWRTGALSYPIWTAVALVASGFMGVFTRNTIRA